MADNRETFTAVVKGDATQALTEFKKYGDQVTKTTTGAKRDLDKLAGKETTGRLDKFAGRAAAAFSVGAIASFGKHVLDAGAALKAMDVKAKTVFEGQARRVEAWSKANAAALGLTTTEATAATSAIADLLKPMGFTAKVATDMSLKLMDLAGALSAWTGGQKSAADVSQTFTKAMLGEREELKSLGISILESEVTAKLAAKGQDKLTGAALAQAKALAVQELIISKSADAQRAWASGAMDGQKAANRSKASFKQLSETLSRELYPSVLSIASGLAKIASAAKPVVSGVAKVVSVATGADAKSMSKPIADFHRNIAGLGNVGLPTVLVEFGKLKKEAGDTRSTLDRASRGWKGFFSGLGGGDPEATNSLDNIRKAFKDLREQSPQDARVVVKALDALRDAARSGNPEAKKLMANWGLSSEVVDEFVRELGTLTTSIQGNSDAAKEAAASRMYAKRIEEEADAVHRDKVMHRQLLRAMTDLDEIRRDSIDGIVDSWTAYNDAEGALQDFKDTLKDSESTLLDQRNAAIDVATAMAEADAAIAKANGHTQTAAEKTAVMVGALQNMAKELDPKSPLRQQLEAYIQQLLRVPQNIATSISLGLSAGGRPVSSVQGSRGPDGERIPTRTAGGVTNNITINTKADANDVIAIIKKYTRSNGRLLV